MDNQSPQHVEPVILTDQVIDLARGWAREWSERRERYAGPERELVSQSSFQFPAGGQEFRVAVFLSDPLPGNAKAFTSLPDRLTRSGEPVGPTGHFSILINHQAPFTPSNLLAVILHELTHVVDPQFLTDCEAKQQWHREWFIEPRRHYVLASERKAFASMWIAEIQEYIRWREAIGEPRFEPLNFINTMARQLPEFEGFLRGCPEFWSETISQIKLIEQAVRGRE